MRPEEPTAVGPGPFRSGRLRLSVLISFLALAQAGPAPAASGPAPAADGRGWGPPTDLDRGPRGGAGEGETDVWVEREARLMGTILRVELAAASRDEGFRAAGVALDEVAGVEDRWSTWREDSDLARLNRGDPGRSVSLPGSMAEVLEELAAWSRRTGHAFDPAVGPLVDAWGLRGDGRRPPPGELRQAREVSGMSHFRVDSGSGTAARLTEGAWLDAGAFGKGLALRQARRALRERGRDAVLLDFGGQLVAWGAGPGRERCWRVGVAHPAARREPVRRLELCDASAATTSGSERFTVVDGQVRTHVLDPRSGEPVAAWGSVTVVHGDPMVADLLSTALFVMGPGQGIRWARENGIAALFLEKMEGHRIRASATQAMQPMLDPVTGDRAGPPPARRPAAAGGRGASRRAIALLAQCGRTKPAGDRRTID